MPYFPDNGTKHNIIPRKVVTEVLRVCPGAEIQHLQNPVTGKAVEGAIIRCDEYIKLDLELFTSAGRVRMREATCIITETEEDEFLLGQQTLKTLGIDVEEQLSALANKEIVDFDPFEAEILLCFDPPDKLKIVRRLCELINEAVANGFPTERKKELFDAVWRFAIGNDPPSKIEPFVIRFKDGTEPIRCKPRTYAPAEREWMKIFNESLVELGWPVGESNSTNENPCKNGGLRQAVDLCRPNAQIVPLAGTMPSQSTRLNHVKKKKKHKQTLLENGIGSDQESQPYMTVDGIFTPTRLQQGSVDSSLHFQQLIEKIMRESQLLYDNVLAWIDDLLIYAETINEFLLVLDRVNSTLEQHGLFLGLDKICLYTSEAIWCGRVIKEDGIAYNPDKIQTLVDLPEPHTAAELQQFLCAAGWMRNSLVDLDRVAVPLQQCLQDVLAGTKRTKHVAARLSIRFTEDERQSFKEFKQLLSNSATLVTPDDTDKVILMTDASDWGEVSYLRLCLTGILSALHERHFQRAAQHWSVSEKEAFPIIKAATDLDYLLIRSKGFSLYSDHQNLIFIFGPGDEIKKYIRGKLQGWSLKLNELRYTIEHISGEGNVWADMASRWACEKPVMHPMIMKRSQVDANPGRVELRPLRPDSEWPNLADIQAA
ncbi:hypothetical protein PHMEG_00017650 [Phytophthora megakarya]|uniref:Reverse transcriptase domain-containing protein n=1 Tax=Phytophthora megakarya TaxID=4795 RepID=A0A225VXC6_9STRA|nr:hypothetical protein PHMEG_00017650 [Phytophthora megakarya]